MIAVLRLIPNSPGRGLRPVSSRERVGNEAAVSTWYPARDGLVTKQLAFPVTRSNFIARSGGVMSHSGRNHLDARRLSRRSNRCALDEATSNKPWVDNRPLAFQFQCLRFPTAAVPPL
jgi:hypothetical protein